MERVRLIFSGRMPEGCSIVAWESIKLTNGCIHLCSIIIASVDVREKKMKVCFPTGNLQGLESVVYGHFGSAPGFVIVDTESREIEEINNGDLHHAHGMCQPLMALGGRKVEAIVVGGIGAGALMKLQAMGIKVYRAAEGTVSENISFILKGNLPEFDARFTCAGHAGGGCAH